MSNSSVFVFWGLVGGSMGLILVVCGLWISWDWLKFRFGPLEYTAPRMTPEELAEVRAYCQRQAALERDRRVTLENQTADFIEQQKEQTLQRRAKQRAAIRAKAKFKRYRKRLWQKRKLRKRQIEKFRIERQFPPWLVTEAKRLKIERSQENLEALRGWIRYVLEYGIAELGHTLPIKPVYYGLRDCDAAPFPGLTSFHFFRRLSKTMTGAGLLIPQTSNKGNRIALDAMNLLYPSVIDESHLPALRVARYGFPGPLARTSGKNGRVAKIKNPASHKANLAH